MHLRGLVAAERCGDAAGRTRTVEVTMVHQLRATTDTTTPTTDGRVASSTSVHNPVTVESNYTRDAIGDEDA